MTVISICLMNANVKKDGCVCCVKDSNSKAIYNISLKCFKISKVVFVVTLMRGNINSWM